MRRIARRFDRHVLPVEAGRKRPLGSEVVQKIVPDRPLPQIAFIKPNPQKGSHPVASKQPTKKVGKPPTGSAQKTPTSAGTMTGGRDGTMDPFK